MAYDSIACIADTSEKAQTVYNILRKKNKFTTNPEKADVIIVLGGDGFMLHCLHKYMDLNIPFYGINCGTIGFLMNSAYNRNLQKSLEVAKTEIISPLRMVATNIKNKKYKALAVNEVSLLRSSRQAANLRIGIDGKVKIEELTCDGVLVSTPAGSTAYNLSVHGPIIPLGAGILALTPISPFRPRRWKGALIPHKTIVRVEVLSPEKRPVNAVADFTEVKNIRYVEIFEDNSKTISLLFDPGHSLEERIISEQFTN